CLTTRQDALFQVCEALVCAPPPVHHLAQLSLEPEHHRGHGSAYAALNQGRLDTDRLGRHLAALPLPRFHGRLVLACDISPWLRPDAWTSPERSWCHTYGRGTGQAEMVPGWPYSMITALAERSTSWTAPLSVARLPPGAHETTFTATQVRNLLTPLTAAVRHRPKTPISWWWSTRATTPPAWPTSWPIYRCRCWDGCVATGSCTARPIPGRRPRRGVRPSTGHPCAWAPLPPGPNPRP